MTDLVLTSRRHPLVARCRDAADGQGPDVLLDGPHLVGDALSAGTSITTVVVAEGADARPEMASLLARARRLGVPVQTVTPGVLDAASPTRTPSGVLALATLPERPLEALLVPAPALVTVAVGVQDPGNVGALIRSSEAAGATGLLAIGGTARPYGWKALRGSMGSALRLPIARPADGLAALQTVRAAGVRLVALAADATATLDEADLDGALAVCVGAEGVGLPADVVALADQTVRIPMQPPVESLNVAVAASLVLFEIARRRRGHVHG